jgi:hypothetical protein
MSKDNGIDPKIIDDLKKVLEKGDTLKNLYKIAEMLSEPKKSDAVRNLITNKALEKVQEKDKISKEMLAVDPRLNLLLALKPFLSESKVQQVDKVTKAMSLGTLFKDLNSLI